MLSTTNNIPDTKYPEFAANNTEAVTTAAPLAVHLNAIWHRGLYLIQLVLVSSITAVTVSGINAATSSERQGYIKGYQ